jgi:hypothetical protein
MIHRFVHISDIHFGQERDGSLVKHDFVRDALLDDVRKICEQRGRQWPRWDHIRASASQHAARC